MNSILIDQIIGITLLVFGIIIFLIFIMSFVVKLVISIVAILFIKKGLNLLGYDIISLYRFMNFINLLKFKIKKGTKN